MEFDVLITGGQVMDGTGAPASRTDVGVRAGRVAALGDLAGAAAATTIDASGRVVTPGFIAALDRARVPSPGMQMPAIRAVSLGGWSGWVSDLVCGWAEAPVRLRAVVVAGW